MTAAVEVNEGYRVLIVEDEAVVAMDLESSLHQLRHDTVAVARTALDAVEMADQHRPDLALMDIQLQGEKDGIWAAGEILRHWDIPSVFITANTNDEILSRVKASGPYGFLNKPFRPKELEAAISIAIRQHRLVNNLFAGRSWFSTTMASLTDGVIATDAGGLVRFINPAAERLTGWTKTEAIGRPIEEVYSLCTLADGNIAECQIRKAIATRQPIPKSRFLLNVKNDHTVPIEDAASPILEEEQLLGAVTTFVDITDRLRAEKRAGERQQQLEQEVHVTTEALGQTRGELRALSQHLMSAQEDERRRIARELHDHLGQQVALLGIQAATLGHAAPQELMPSIDRLQTGLSDLATGLRDVSHRLHPAVIEDLGLSEALAALVGEYRQHNVAIIAKIDKVPAVPLVVATSLYRIAQEALQNIRKHVPDAPVHVRLMMKFKTLYLCVKDHGTSFSPTEARSKGGLGLISMQERAHLAGGTLLLTARPNKGTTVLVRVNLQG